MEGEGGERDGEEGEGRGVDAFDLMEGAWVVEAENRFIKMLFFIIGYF